MPKDTLIGATVIQSVEYFKVNILILISAIEDTSRTIEKCLNFNTLLNTNFNMKRADEYCLFYGSFYFPTFLKTINI